MWDLWKDGAPKEKKFNANIKKKIQNYQEFVLNIAEIWEKVLKVGHNGKWGITE